MGPDMRKPVFQVSDRVRFKPAYLSAETSKNIEILVAACIDMVLFNKLITKALIRPRVCAGWSAPLLFANPRRQDFSCQGTYMRHSCMFEKLGFICRRLHRKMSLVAYGSAGFSIITLWHLPFFYVYYEMAHAIDHIIVMVCFVMTLLSCEKSVPFCTY